MNKIVGFISNLFPGFILLVAIATWAIAVGPAEGTYYVAPTGSDTNPGTIKAPWKTLLYAIRNTHPGDTILMRSGTYQEYEVWIRETHGWGGAPGKFKTIAAYPGEEPVIQSHNGILIYSSWMRIQGLRFQDVGIGSSLEDGTENDHIEILNNRFYGAFGYGAIDFIGKNGRIEGNVIEITAQRSELDHGIYLHAGENNVVRNNRISNTQGFGIHVYDERKRTYKEDTIKNGFHNILIENNTITGSKGASGIIIASADQIPIRNVMIRNNVLSGNDLNGIEVRTGDGVAIYNNTIYDSGRQGIHLGGEPDVKNVSIQNNIIVSANNNVCKLHCTWYGHYHIESSGAIGLLVLTQNLYWPSSLGFHSVKDAHAIFQDPLFVNPQANDFHLRLGSPAIDKGANVGLPYTGAAPDLGAFEFDAPAAAPTEKDKLSGK